MTKEHYQNVSCNVCGGEFAPVTHHRKIRDDIERVYMKCTHCGAEFTAHYTNNDIRELQKRQRDLAHYSGAARHTATFRRNKERMQRMMDALKEEIEGVK